MNPIVGGGKSAGNIRSTCAPEVEAHHARRKPRTEETTLNAGEVDIGEIIGGIGLRRGGERDAASTGNGLNLRIERRINRDRHTAGDRNLRRLVCRGIVLGVDSGNGRVGGDIDRLDFRRPDVARHLGLGQDAVKDGDAGDLHACRSRKQRRATLGAFATNRAAVDCRVVACLEIAPVVEFASATRADGVERRSSGLAVAERQYAGRLRKCFRRVVPIGSIPNAVYRSATGRINAGSVLVTTAAERCRKRLLGVERKIGVLEHHRHCRRKACREINLHADVLVDGDGRIVLA